MMYVFKMFLLVALSLSMAVWGEETNLSARVVVTASRIETQLEATPETIRVISRQEIDESQPSSTGQLFEYNTGVATATGTGSGAPKRTVISLNGLPPQYTLVLVDGVPLLSEHIHTGQNIELVPPGLIERIEVLRGAAGAQYGSGAMGGVVNIITKKSGDQPAGSLGVSGGSFDTIQSHASLFMPLADGVRLSSAVNWERSDGQPLLAPAHRVDQTGYENLTFYNRLDVDLSDLTHLFAAVNGANHQMEWRGDWSDSQQLSVVGGLDHELMPELHLSSKISYSEWEAAINGELNQLTKPELFVRWDLGNGHTVMVGGDSFYNTFERTSVTAPSQQGVGVFVQDEWTLSETLSLLTALRYDYVDGVGGALCPKIAMLWMPSVHTSFRVSASQGFHAPTLQELYEEGYGHGGRAYRFGNPDLNPEYSTTYSAGAEVEVVEGLSLMLNGFYTEFDDHIVPVYEGAWAEDPSIDVWRRRNISKALVVGMDLGARWQINEPIRVELGCTATTTEDQSTGRQLPYSPGISAYAKLVCSEQILDHDVTAFFGARSAFGREAWSWKPASSTTPNTSEGLSTELDDYVAFDLGVRVALTQRLDSFIKVENITGEEIENLDDSYTVLDGCPFARVGLTYHF